MQDELQGGAGEGKEWKRRVRERKSSDAIMERIKGTHKRRIGERLIKGSRHDCCTNLKLCGTSPTF